MNDQKKTLSLSVKDIRASGSVSEKDLGEIEKVRMEAKLQAEVDEWRRKKHSQKR